jgi:hypothetical protein
MIRYAVAALLAATVVACGGSDGGGGDGGGTGGGGGGGGGGGSFQATCNFPDEYDRTCMVFISGWTSLGLTAGQAECSEDGGVWSTTAACPATGRLGTCTSTIGGAGTWALVYYDRAEYTAEIRTAISQGCAQSGGTWTAN